MPARDAVCGPRGALPSASITAHPAMGGLHPAFATPTAHLEATEPI